MDAADFEYHHRSLSFKGMRCSARDTVLDAVFTPPSVCAHLVRTRVICITLNHQCCGVPTEPKRSTPVASWEIIRTIFKFCGT